MDLPIEGAFRELVPGDSISLDDVLGLHLSVLAEHCPSLVDEDAKPLHLLFALSKLRLNLPIKDIAMMFGESEAVVSDHLWPFIKAIGHLGDRMVRRAVVAVLSVIPMAMFFSSLHFLCVRRRSFLSTNDSPG